MADELELWGCGEVGMSQVQREPSQEVMLV